MTRIAAPKVSEHLIQAACLEYLGYRGVFCYRNNSGAIPVEAASGRRFIKFGTSGSPDIIAVIEGRFVGIEVKAAKGKLRPSQEAFRDQLTIRGKGIYIVVRSVDECKEEIERLIREFKKVGT